MDVTTENCEPEAQKEIVTDELDTWIQEVLEEYPGSYGLGEWDGEDRRDGGWITSVFDGSVAAQKYFPDITPHKWLKAIWRARGAPIEDVDKKGVLLVRFGWKWGWSKVYAYPIGCVDGIWKTT